jgi:hypothetical protein
VAAYVVCRARMPYLWGKESTRSRLILGLQEIYDHVRNTYRLAEGDFPNIDEFRAVLQRMDFYSFPLTDRRALNRLQDILIMDIPRIIALISGITDSEEAGEADDSFGDLDARAEQILKRSAVKLFNIEDNRGSGTFSWVYVLLAVSTVLTAVAIASFIENHRTVYQLVSAAMGRNQTSLP